MPFYIFENPKGGEKREIRQGMKDPHEYVDENGTKWNRVFMANNMAVDSRPDAFSTKSLTNSTSNKKETIGDIQDRAKEASSKRKQQNGYDPIQSKWFDSYAGKRRGKRHPRDPSGGSDAFEV
jgi:hypothetical protein|tara:strand:+ start:1137 stop:1505 length:369 start_codon:yes stop_codon:yes gene_type:complete